MKETSSTSRSAQPVGSPLNAAKDTLIWKGSLQQQAWKTIEQSKSLEVRVILDKAAGDEDAAH
jgi:hypothetical protein